MNSGLTTPGLLGFFAASNMALFVVIFLIVEETRRLSLEELDRIYEQPKGRHIGYQTDRLRYLFKRYILRQTVNPRLTYDELIARDADAENGFRMTGGLA